MAKIAGGSTRSISVEESLVLDASSSTDLDYPPVTNFSSLTFEWNCVMVDGSYCFNQNGYALELPSDPKIVFPDNSLIANGRCILPHVLQGRFIDFKDIFTVVVRSNDSRNASKTITITTSPEIIPSVTILTRYPTPKYI